jgi:hypothetical protein
MRFVMREFGMCVGGIKVLNEAFSPLSGDDGLEVWLLGEEGLYTIASSGMTVPELLVRRCTKTKAAHKKFVLGNAREVLG